MPAAPITVLVGGSFDHVCEDTEHFLKTAEGLGDVLVVAVTEGEIPISKKIDTLEKLGYAAAKAKRNSIFESVKASRPAIFACREAMPQIEDFVRGYGGLVTRFPTKHTARTLVDAR